MASGSLGIARDNRVRHRDFWHENQTAAEEQYEAVRIDANATSIVGTFATTQEAMVAADRVAGRCAPVRGVLRSLGGDVEARSVRGERTRGACWARLKEEGWTVAAGIVKCPHCGLKVIPRDDGVCPSCRSFEFSATLPQSGEGDFEDLRPRPRIAPTWQERRSVNLIALSSFCLGVIGVLLGPRPSSASMVAVMSGMWALLAIRRSQAAQSGVWLARIGIVLGATMTVVSAFLAILGRHGK